MIISSRRSSETGDPLRVGGVRQAIWMLFGRIKQSATPDTIRSNFRFQWDAQPLC
jgi:hypothetical protein